MRYGIEYEYGEGNAAERKAGDKCGRHRRKYKSESSVIVACGYITVGAAEQIEDGSTKMSNTNSVRILGRRK